MARAAPCIKLGKSLFSTFCSFSSSARLEMVFFSSSSFLPRRPPGPTSLGESSSVSAFTSFPSFLSEFRFGNCLQLRYSVPRQSASERGASKSKERSEEKRKTPRGAEGGRGVGGGVDEEEEDDGGGGYIRGKGGSRERRRSKVSIPSLFSGIEYRMVLLFALSASLVAPHRLRCHRHRFPSGFCPRLPSHNRRWRRRRWTKTDAICEAASAEIGDME